MTAQTIDTHSLDSTTPLSFPQYKNREYFAQFVTEDIDSYVSRKRNNHVHGNHIEIQAISEIFNRPVELYSYDSGRCCDVVSFEWIASIRLTVYIHSLPNFMWIEPANIFNSDQLKIGIDPLRLSYQRGSHYNAISNPYKPTVGVGLGLAGYRIVDESPNVKHMRDAVRMSEDQEIEQTMFEDKLKTTDWEATNEAIEEQIARESYLQWCRENHQAQKQKQQHQQQHQQQQHQQLLMPGVQSSSTITSTTVTASMGGSYAYGNKHHGKTRDSDDSGSCGSADDNNRDELSDGSDSMKSYSKYSQQQYQGRKRRSNRRRTPKNSSNINNSNGSGSSGSGSGDAGVGGGNCVSNSSSSSNNTSGCSSGSANFANEVSNEYERESNQCTDDAGHSKKRKIMNQDVPGPSSCYRRSSPSNQDKPMSDFYHSLLESSYAEPGGYNGK